MSLSYYTAYQTLGLPAGAGLAEIKAAYRRLAMRHHPDRGGDVAEFQKITAAYNQLVERASSDKQHMPPLRARISVTLEQIYAGKPLVLAVPVDNATRFIEFEVDPTWSHGQQVTVEDPARLDSRVTVMYNILQHPTFTKAGLDLICQVQVPVWDLIIGGRVTVTDLAGQSYQVTVRPTSVLTPAPTITLAGRGFRCKTGAVGNLCVILEPVLPKSVSPALKEAIIAEQSLQKGST